MECREDGEWVKVEVSGGVGEDGEADEGGGDEGGGGEDGGEGAGGEGVGGEGAGGEGGGERVTRRGIGDGTDTDTGIVGTKT